MLSPTHIAFFALPLDQFHFAQSQTEEAHRSQDILWDDRLPGRSTNNPPETGPKPSHPSSILRWPAAAHRQPPPLAAGGVAPSCRTTRTHHHRQTHRRPTKFYELDIPATYPANRQSATCGSNSATATSPHRRTVAHRRVMTAATWSSLPCLEDIFAGTGPASNLARTLAPPPNATTRHPNLDLTLLLLSAGSACLRCFLSRPAST